ncbi:hypothetical protein [Nocardioides sp.]|uniref:hypothetical protein n=1 Tax=Nocardioides sp. TaxID=35761 RepID=UPI0035678AF4
MSTLSLSALTATAEPHVWGAVNPYVIGLVTLGILLALLGGLVAFGAGREHS